MKDYIFEIRKEFTRVEKRRGRGRLRAVAGYRSLYEEAIATSSRKGRSGESYVRVYREFRGGA